VTAHIKTLGYTPADVTSYFFAWEWDRAWRWLQHSDKTTEAEALKSEFIEFCFAQLAYDQRCCRQVFGHDVIGITHAHYVAFFAEVADPLRALMRREGIEFVPLADALADPAYERVATVVTDGFHVYQHKLSIAAGREIGTRRTGLRKHDEEGFRTRGSAATGLSGRTRAEPLRTKP
jgi:peptidoglycan-N-acetylglucosamine deacetylase